MNDCRELVEVPGEPEWKLRSLAESFPQYCWKYAEPELIAHYHCSIAKTADVPTKQPTATVPIFYAHLPNSFSPYEFSIQPKALYRVQKRLYEQIQVAYSEGNDFEVSVNQMCAGAACVVLVSNKWMRAKIVKFSKGEDVLVDLVDIGNENIVRTQDLRPLLKMFGRLPPLAMRCRMKNVSINDLSFEKVNAFQELINSCGGLVRVEITDASSVPFMVNLYHPTIQNENLGERFYFRKKYVKHEVVQEKQWNKKLSREDDSSSSSDKEQKIFEERSQQTAHVLHLEKLQKPLTDELLYISHVENSRFIYLHSEYHKQAIERLERFLMIKWFEMEPIPARWLKPTVACAYSSNCHCKPCRVIIADVGDQTVWVRSADHGWKKCVSKLACLAGNLRLLTREFSEKPLMYVCRLPLSMQYHPHQSETDILRTILTVGTSVSIRRYRSKRTIPSKVDIFLQNGESVVDILERIKTRKRVVHPCFDMVPYKTSVYSPLYQLNCDYQEDLEIFRPFVKGRLKYGNLQIGNSFQ